MWLPCAHGPFHRQCIGRATSIDTRCPICRFQLNGQEIQLLAGFLREEHGLRLQVLEHVGRPNNEGPGPAEAAAEPGPPLAGPAPDAAPPAAVEVPGPAPVPGPAAAPGPAAPQDDGE